MVLEVMDLVDCGLPRRGSRDGDGPRGGGHATDGDRPRGGGHPRDGGGPRRGGHPRDSGGPRRGGGHPRDSGARRGGGGGPDRVGHGRSRGRRNRRRYRPCQVVSWLMLTSLITMSYITITEFTHSWRCRKNDIPMPDLNNCHDNSKYDVFITIIMPIYIKFCAHNNTGM